MILILKAYLNVPKNRARNKFLDTKLENLVVSNGTKRRAADMKKMLVRRAVRGIYLVIFIGMNYNTCGSITLAFSNKTISTTLAFSNKTISQIWCYGLDNFLGYEMNSSLSK